MIRGLYGIILVLTIHFGIHIAQGADTSLVAHWKFDETGGTTATDSSGNGYAGTLLNGATWGPGRLGGALVLDGINDYVSIPDYNLAQGVGAFSVSLWFQSPTGASTTDRKIVGTADAGRETFGIQIARSGSTGKISFQVCSAAGSKPVAVVADARFTSTDWTHVAGIYDGTRLRLYVNGVLQANSTALSGLTYNSKKTVEVSSTAQPFAGKVDDIRIYHRVLSSAEVTALYSVPNPLPDLSAPTVAVTSPTENAVVSGTISLKATAQDNVAVAGVRFFVDGVVVGSEDTSAPYEISWDTLSVPNGIHSITAVARDTSNNEASSPITKVTVNNLDTTPPNVAITSPLADAVVAETISLKATAQDNVAVAGVRFFVDGVLIGSEDTAASYEISWNTLSVQNGLHSLTAVARDTSNNEASSLVTKVTVNNLDTTPPTVAITTPTANALVSEMISIQATAQDNVAVAGVRFFVDGLPVGGEDTSSPYEVSWDTLSFQNGAHSITAVARDSSNNETVSEVIEVTVNNLDTTPPSIAITSPLGDAVVVGTISLQATAQDNIAVAGVRFFVDGLPVGGEDTSAPYEISWDTLNVQNGIHSIRAVARDSSNNETVSEVIEVIVNNLDTTPPIVAITSPLEDAVVVGIISFQATAQDNVAVAGLQFFVDGVLVGSEDTSASYELSWNSLSVQNGTHSIRAVARDTSNNEASSPVIKVTVNNLDTAPPSVAITSPLENAVVAETIFLKATAQDNIAVAGVRFFVDGLPVGGEDTSSPYEVSWDTLSFQNGAHSITAVARDSSNNETVAEFVEVTVNNLDTTPPTVAITNPTANALVSDTISLQAIAQDNISVTGVRFFVDGIIVGSEDTSSPYEVSWDTLSFQNGVHSIRAVAIDTSNNEAVSQSIKVTVNNLDTTPPTLAITSPLEDAVVVGTISMKATAQDNVAVAGVRFIVDGTIVGDEDTSPPYEISWDTLSVENGIHSITAVARDTSNNEASSPFIKVTVNNLNTTPPTVEITSPVEDAEVEGTILIQATAHDNGAVAGVRFFVDGVILGTEDTSPPYEISWDTLSVPNGVYSLTAVARDTFDNEAVAHSIEVTVNNPDIILPTITITEPAAGSIFNNSSTMVSIKATADDDRGVAGVSFFLDGVPLAPEDTVPPYEIIWNTTTASEANHVITATARDTSGNTKSAAISVTVSRTDLSGGLMAYWKLDESGGTAALDSSGHGYGGALLNGATWGQGRLGGGLVLDGVNDFVSIPDYNLTQGVDAFSATFWFQASTGASTVDRKLLGYVADAGRETFGIRIARSGASGKIHFQAFNAAGVKGVVLGNTLFTSTAWTHVAGIYDGARLSLYVNGVLQTNSAALSGLTFNSKRTLEISSTNQPFAGKVDSVRIYHRALNAQEVAALYSRTEESPSADLEAPTVVLQSPNPGATVVGDVEVKASAQDNTAVARVQFYLDGLPFASPDTSAPYSAILDSRLFSNGSHMISAKAVDNFGNAGMSAPLEVVIANPPNIVPTVPAITRASAVGQSQVNVAWTVSQDESPLVYSIYRCAGEGCSPAEFLGSTTATSYRDVGLAADTLYRYSISASDPYGGISAPSTPTETRTFTTADCCAEGNPRFSFGLFSDTYSGQSGGMLRACEEMSTQEPNLHFIVGAGDYGTDSTYDRIRGLLDRSLSDSLKCGAQEFPWFPAVGNHEYDSPTSMEWWATTYANNWNTRPEESRLALQLPGVRNFKRGPTSVMGATNSVNVAPGTIYSFDYKNVHFVFVNTYEQLLLTDPNAGVFDRNGSDVFDPSNSQFDWVAKDLAETTQPIKFVVGHVALVAPCYNFDPPLSKYPCDGPPPPGWSEHNSIFHMSDFTRLLAYNNVTAYFFGHDHVPSRHLLDRNNSVVYPRPYWTSKNDPLIPFGTASEWTDLQGPGKVWELDAGKIHSEYGSYIICRINENSVTFDTYSYLDSLPGSTILQDTFTIPIP